MVIGSFSKRERECELILHHHKGESGVFAVGEREGDGGDAELFCPLGGATGELQGGLSAGLADDLEVEPADATADAGAEGLGGGFLGGEAGGEALRGVLFATAVGDLAAR